MIRNVFECETQSDSRLMTGEERDTCQSHVYRAVHVSHLSMMDLEPVLSRYRTQIKVIFIHQDPRSVFFNDEISENGRMFGTRICLQMIRDIQRMEEFSAYTRNVFSIFNDEIFSLFSEKIISDVNNFLEVEAPTQLDFSKLKLQKNFIQNYSWLVSKPRESIDKVDDKCQGLYELSIYKSVKDNNTFSLKHSKYPLRFQIKL